MSIEGDKRIVINEEMGGMRDSFRPFLIWLGYLPTPDLWEGRTLDSLYWLGWRDEPLEPPLSILKTFPSYRDSTYLHYMQTVTLTGKWFILENSINFTSKEHLVRFPSFNLEKSSEKQTKNPS